MPDENFEFKLDKLQKIIDESENIVFFGGAGVSTESGIPDFRSADGLYQSKYGDVSPETILSRTYFEKNPELFFQFYREKILMVGSGLDIKPNIAHKWLAEAEKAGKLKAVVTQNIDTLHQQAGSKNVYQIHGTVAMNHCEKCGEPYQTSVVEKTDSVPICPDCGGVIKPDVVLYEESLPDKVWRDAILSIKAADCLIVAGTSLSVYPASSLLDYFHGKHLVIINRDTTPSDQMADLVIHDSIGKVFENLKLDKDA